MLQKLVTWLDTYREVAFDLLRIYLSVGLFVRGVLFFYDPVAITAMLPPDTPAWVASGGLLNVVALVHSVGGALIAVGFWTRIAALTQVPILFAAVFLSVAGLFSADQSFEFSTLVLFMLILVFLYGSGKWSVDYYLFVRKTRAEVATRTELAPEILTHTVPEEEAFADPIGTLAVPEAKTAPTTIEELRDDPMIMAQARYSFWGWFLFLADVTPRPKEIVFRNIRTGKIIKRSKDPAVLEQFRYQ